jgi:hypothetical protein
MSAPSNATQFVHLVESRLGWSPRVGTSHWRAVSIEAHRVKAKVETDPTLYTWENLALAVELLAKEKKPRTPLGVFAHVQRALDLAMDHEDDVEAEIREVMKFEVMRGDPQGWAVRFARADGGYRRMLLREWQESAR